MTTTHYTADLTDPITGEHTHLTATTQAELEQMLDQVIAQAYPQNPPAPGAPHDEGLAGCGGRSCRDAGPATKTSAAGWRPDASALGLASPTWS